ncbi:MAG TPA: DUF1566 domain-containing protein, partial [Deltaproteobacteria bacterium]|nr:DUF1566 domain-containing protein [Deltaproteobacteria bacterium]
QQEILSDNADLSGLSLSQGALSPGFDANKTIYIAEVSYNIESVEVTPTVAGDSATVTVNGTEVPSGTAFGPIELDYGIDNLIYVVVTAQSGATKVYAVVVNRLFEHQSDNANLANLVLSADTALDPVFSSDDSTYTAEVAHEVSSITATPTAESTTAKIKVNGNQVISGSSSWPIARGTTAINVEVVAQNGVTTKIYTVVLTWLDAPSNNADLVGLSLSQGILDPLFDRNTTDYHAEVPSNISSLTVTPITAGAGAAVKVNGQAVQSGTASPGIALEPGTNYIYVEVTAQDNTTKKTYNVQVTKLFTVTYVSEGHTSGTAPADTTGYRYNDPFTVLGNTGNLIGQYVGGAHADSGIRQSFVRWTDGTNYYLPGQTFNIEKNMTLHAVYTTGNNVLRKIGPAGGWVFYDHGSEASWGRYLEAAPASTDASAVLGQTIMWQYPVGRVWNTDSRIGYGRSNTQRIMAWLASNPQGDIIAAQFCDELSYGGYNDWFLPSQDELNKMWVNLARGTNDDDGIATYSPVGDFRRDIYWSSTESDRDGAMGRSFFHGEAAYFWKQFGRQVRAVRAF